MVVDDIPNPLFNLFNSSGGIDIDPSISPMYLFKVGPNDLGELSLDLVLEFCVLISLPSKPFAIVQRLIAKSEEDDQVW
jgi:hypothetical protein